MPEKKRYLIGSRDVTFNASAKPAELAGTTATRWYAYDTAQGRDVAGGTTREEVERAVAELVAWNTPTTATFADGSTRVVSTGLRVRLLGLDDEGNLVVTGDGMTYALTPCCNATGKGADVTTGVVCRSCYEEVSSRFGDVADVTTAVAG